MPRSALRRASTWYGRQRAFGALRTSVRLQHAAEVVALHDAFHERFNRTNADFINVFRAAAEMALMEQIGQGERAPEDRRLLRNFWETLLAAT